MPDVVRNGVRLAWTADGAADLPVLLLSNSLGTTMALWDAIVPRLAARFRVVRYDTRGHGASDRPAGDYSLDALGRDALAVLDAAGAARASVGGISLGGLTAMWLGIHAPLRIDRLVLANTGARIGTDELWNERIRLVLESGMGAIVDGLLWRWFTPDFRAQSPDVLARYRAMISGTPPVGYAGCCAALRDADLRPGLRTIRAPTLVIGGTADVATPLALSEVIEAGIPGARLERLPAAHLSNVERPEAFASLVIDFLSAERNVAVDDATGRERGRAARRSVLGEAHVSRAEAAPDPLTAEFQDLITRYAWGEIWTRPGLDERTRRVLVLGTLVALGRWEEFRLHARAAATEGGMTADDIKEILLQQAIYCGVPAANTAFDHLRQALAG